MHGGCVSDVPVCGQGLLMGVRCLNHEDEYFGWRLDLMRSGDMLKT